MLPDDFRRAHAAEIPLIIVVKKENREAVEATEFFPRGQALLLRHFPAAFWAKFFNESILAHGIPCLSVVAPQ